MTVSSRERARVIRDPLYNYVQIPPELFDVIDHPMIQRLRQISQTSMAVAVYPSMTGTRFEHALGTMHLTMSAWDNAYNNPSSHNLGENFLAEIKDEFQLPGAQSDLAELVGVAVGFFAALHDCGHPPFSHILEPFFADHHQRIFAGNGVLKQWEPNVAQLHEFIGRQIAIEIANSCIKNDTVRKISLRLLDWRSDDSTTNSWAHALRGLVSGEIDCERLDYLMRDAQRAGTEFGAIDFSRLLRAVELKRLAPAGWEFGFGVRALSSVETLLIQRSQAYKWILHHHRVSASDAFLVESLHTLMELEGCDKTVPTLSSQHLVGDLFRRLRPNLDYVSGTWDRRLIRLRSLEALMLPGDAVSLSYPLTPPQQERWSEITRSTVDDASVWNWLHDGAALAEWLTEGHGIKDDSLKKFRSLYYAVCFRRHNYVPAWKTYGDYAAIAKEVSAELSTQISITFGKLQETHKNNLLASNVLSRLQESVSTRLCQESDVRNMNAAVDMTVRDNPGRFQQFLSASHTRLSRTHEGFWHVVHKRFSSVKRVGAGAALYHGENRMPLRSISAVADALYEADLSRITILLYWIWYDQDTSRDERRNAQALMREAFKDCFVAYFAEYLEGLAEATLSDALGGGSNDSN